MWKVLVIEDDPMLADIHKKYIENQNDFTCVGVIYDASSGMDLIESENPDLILLDVYMPQMNGLDFLYLSRSRRLSAQSTRFSITSFSNPKFRRAKLISSSTFSENSWSSGFWKTVMCDAAEASFCRVS